MVGVEVALTEARGRAGLSFFEQLTKTNPTLRTIPVKRDIFLMMLLLIIFSPIGRLR
jgi:hypothetical protein